MKGDAVPFVITMVFMAGILVGALVGWAATWGLISRDKARGRG